MKTDPDAGAAATARMPGFDVARALAILGMVIVNYKATLGSEERGPQLLVWLSNRLDGRAAATFVVLAGVGASLRSRRARLEPRVFLASERQSLIKRGLLLFLVGLANLHLWESDILHFYGVYLLLAALLLGTRDAVLWAVGLGVLASSALLEAALEYYSLHELWSAPGFASDVLFNGLHPVFPWFSLLLLGMWLGRRNLALPAVRRRITWTALLAALAAELLDAVATRLSGGDLVDPWHGTSPSPPYPGFVIAAGGTAVALICVCIALTESRKRAPWVQAMMATGQMAFTIYLAHAAVVVMALQHESFHLRDASLVLTMALSVAFYVLAVIFSVWWRGRWNYGPLEGLVRQVTGQGSPTSWGGARVSLVPPSVRAAPPSTGRAKNDP